MTTEGITASADGAWDVQAGLYDHLTANDGVTALLASGADSVLDHVPGGTAFPYIVIGEARAVPLETQGTTGRDVTLTLHCYSRYDGMKEIKAVMSAVSAALQENFPVSGQAVVLCRELNAAVYLQNDGQTRHGVQQFRIITEPTE